MRLEPGPTIVLSRRNLEALLAKLDGYPERSSCLLYKLDPAYGAFGVLAEENDVHYGDVPTGCMESSTETRISRPSSGVA